MSTKLFPQGFDVTKFYSRDLEGLSDEVGVMLRFAGPEHSDDLQHHHCNHQMLHSVDGEFIRLFGSLGVLKDQLGKPLYQNLCLEAGKAFYLLKRDDYAGFAKIINGMSDLLSARLRNKSAANDG